MEYAYQIGELIAGIIMHQASKRQPLNSFDLTQRVAQQTGGSPEKTITAALSNVYKRNRAIHRRKIKIERLPQKVYHYWYDPTQTRTVDLGGSLRARRKSPLLAPSEATVPPAPPPLPTPAPAWGRDDARGFFWDDRPQTLLKNTHLIGRLEPHGIQLVAIGYEGEREAREIAARHATQTPGKPVLVFAFLAAYELPTSVVVTERD